jgi:hypothetical protein
MNQLAFDFGNSSDVTETPSGVETLADVKRVAKVDPTQPATRKRDVLSALNRVPVIFATPFDKIDATPQRVRALFASKTAAEVGLSDKTYANIRSLVSLA